MSFGMYAASVPAFLQMLKRSRYRQTRFHRHDLLKANGGRKAFQTMTRINGKLHRFGLGFYPRISLADARGRAEQVLRDAAKGISPEGREAEQQREAQAERLNSFRAVAAEFM